jgi:hypothetical protein
VSDSGTIEEMCGFHVHFVLSAHCSMHVLRGSSLIQTSEHDIAYLVLMNRHNHVISCFDGRTFKNVESCTVSIKRSGL